MSTKDNLRSILLQYDLHSRVFRNAFEGISEEESEMRPNDHTNHMKYLAGHLASLRYNLLKFGGNTVENPFGRIFTHNNPLDPEAAYPPLTKIMEMWENTSVHLRKILTSLDQNMLDSPAYFNPPLADDTTFGLLTFLMHHEAYHIGQLGILRRYLGKPAIDFMANR
jgi:uncharacterized damage-inducible protein DinB